MKRLSASCCVDDVLQHCQERTAARRGKEEVGEAMKSSKLILAIVAWSKRMGASTAAETAGELRLLRQSPTGRHSRRSPAASRAARRQRRRRIRECRAQAASDRKPARRSHQAVRHGTEDPGDPAELIRHSGECTQDADAEPRSSNRACAIQFVRSRSVRQQS